MAITQKAYETLGVAGSQTEKDISEQVLLLPGFKFETQSFKMSSALKTAGLAKFGLVYLTAASELDIATGEAGKEAEFILPMAVSAGTTKTEASVWIEGGFNLAALVWPAAYNTVDKKKTAFRIKNPNIVIDEKNLNDVPTDY